MHIATLLYTFITYTHQWLDSIHLLQFDWFLFSTSHFLFFVCSICTLCVILHLCLSTRWKISMEKTFQE
ncbi:hypothetical protein HanIR_Chr10g0458881 [Helianthus annuus]|nr:hypothetical protein HanIR_Chr10g0458881 [Helianthus annuus]